jgi:hypothetical protein
MHNLEIVTAELVNKWDKEIWFAVEFGSDNGFFIHGCSHEKYCLDECGHDIFVCHELNYSESLLNAYGHDKRLVKNKGDVTFGLWISRQNFWFMNIMKKFLVYEYHDKIFGLWISRQNFWFVNATIEFCWFMNVATKMFHSWM